MNNLKRFARTAADEPLPFSSSPAQLAANVQPDAELAASRERFEDLERQLEAVAHEFADMREGMSRNGGHFDPRAAANLTDRQQELQSRRSAEWIRLRELRRAHAVKIEQALGPMRQEIAARLLGTLTEIGADIAVLTDIEDELLRAGGEPIHVPFPACGASLAALRRLVE